ncbi:MAG: serine hydroxymethyltransferase [bacterium]|nr:serine hydroxymethyltransferase [bacterium]
MNHQTDKIFELIALEKRRQQETLDLIPSENIASQEVLAALGSVFTNKYAEGQVGKRYYQGNSVADQVEQLAIDRTKQLFGVNFVNVQALSGAPANQAVYFALLQPGETILGMDLPSGGHLSFGLKVNFSGHYYHLETYSVDKETQLLNYDQILAKANECHPKLIVAGTTAYPRDFDWKKLRQIANAVGAYLLAVISHTSGLVATGLLNNPIGLADVVTSTTHKTLRGPRGALIMTNNEELAKKINRAVFPGLQGGPHLNTIAAIAVALGEDLTPEYKKYTQQIIANAKALATQLTTDSWQLVTGGTDNHLLLVDLRPQNIGGSEAAALLEEAGIITNKNLVPFDSNPPTKPSGLRLGTPSVTSRGLKEKEMILLAGWIQRTLTNPQNPEIIQKVRQEVLALCRQFPIYQDENNNR